VGLHGKDLRLVHVLIVGEEEETIFDDRPADRDPGITTREERIGAERVTSQSRIGGHVVIAEEIVAGAVELITAGTRNDVDRAYRSNARRKVIVGRRKLELLHYFLGEVHPRVAFDRVAYVAAIDGDRRLVGLAAQHRNGEERVVLRGRAGRDRHAR